MESGAYKLPVIKQSYLETILCPILFVSLTLMELKLRKITLRDAHFLVRQTQTRMGIWEYSDTRLCSNFTLENFHFVVMIKFSFE